MDNKNRGIVSLSAYINISHRRIREKIAAYVFFLQPMEGCSQETQRWELLAGAGLSPSGYLSCLLERNSYSWS